MIYTILGLVLAAVGFFALKRFLSVRNKHYQEYINRKIDDLHK